MNKIQEILESAPTILSEKKSVDGDTMNVRVAWAQAGEKTKNGRIYSERILQREIARLQKTVEKGGLIGTGDHNLDGFSNIKNASHIITKLEMDEAGKCWADMKIIPTERGKSAMALIRNKASIGVSQRGFGEVAKDGTVSDSFSLQGIDIVANPSFSGGTLSLDNISESLNFEEKSAPSEELIRFIQSKVYEDGKAVGSSKDMTFEEFLAEHGVAVKASILVERGIYPDIETALASMGEIDILRKMKSEEKTHIYTADEVYWEARTSGVDPKKFAEKLNEIQERKRTDLASGLSEREVGRLISEAERAGVDTSNLEERKKIFDFAKTQVTPGEKTIHEKALHIQAKMLKEGTKEEIGFIENILREEEKKEAIQERRLSIRSQCEREMEQSGAFVNHEQMRKFINRQLKAAGLEPLNEEGE